MTTITPISNEKGPFVGPFFEELLFPSLDLYKREKKRWNKGTQAFAIIPKLTKVKVIGERLLKHIYPFPNGFCQSCQASSHNLQEMLLFLEEDPIWTDQILPFIKRYRLSEIYLKRFFYLAFKSLKSLIPKCQRN